MAVVRPQADTLPTTNPVLNTLSRHERELIMNFMIQQDCDAGNVIVRQGANDQSMFFVLSGRARIERDGLELETVSEGDHFGELGLVARRPRAASVSALEDMTLASMTGEGLSAFSTAHPELAMRFLRALLGGVADRLSNMTESVGAMLRERSLPRRTTVTIRFADESSRAVRTGTEVRSLLPDEEGGYAVVAALLDRRAVSLTHRLSSDGTLAALTTGHWEGRRIFRRSLGLLLLEAASRLEPPAHVHAEPSLGFAQHFEFINPSPDTPMHVFAERIEAEMHAIANEEAPLREELWTLEEASSHFAQAGWESALALLSTLRDEAVPMISYGAVQGLRMGPCLPSTGKLTGFRVIPNEGLGLLLIYGPHGAPPTSPTPSSLDKEAVPSRVWRRETARSGKVRAVSRHTRALAYEHRRWLETAKINSVGDFNRSCIQGQVGSIIRIAEGFQEKRIGRIADEIRMRGSDVKVVCIAGPSSSGKTTFIKRLSIQLQVNGILPVELGLDDYYVDREKTPLDTQGDFDFEAFEALRVDLLQSHLSALLSGEKVRTARFDFARGESHEAGGHELQLADDALLILEGIHGLNPSLLAEIPDQNIFRIFICPLAQLPFDHLNRVHASDARLIRRIVRDRHRRSSTASSTILRWSSVRRGERRHIFPYQHNSDAIFDSSLIYELAVLKVFAERYLLEVPRDDAAYTTAFRLLQLLDRFVTIYPDHVPATSLLREFIGGSGFEY